MKYFFSLLLIFPVLCFGQKDLPDVSLKTLNGQSINVQDYATNGKITVFSFWATWCIPCQKELDNLAELYPDWQEDYNVEVVAVSTDDARTIANVKARANTNGWPFEVLLDSNEDLKRALNFQAIPHTIVVNQEGQIAYTHSGYVEGDEYELEDAIKEMVTVEETPELIKEEDDPKGKKKKGKKKN